MADGRVLPGDELIGDPMLTSTQEITIRRSPHDVWPWLAQMGADRAGWYSYDWIDNGGRRSANCILPAFQQLSIGQTIPALPGAADGFIVLAFEPARFLVLGWCAPGAPPVMTWAFVLEPVDESCSRLVVRARASAQYRFQGLPKWLSLAVVPLAHFAMQRRQLRGIAARVESLPPRLEGRAAVSTELS
jgi:hypothetical protein